MGLADARDHARGRKDRTLTHLRSFPVDILKIDRSFVRNVVVHSAEDRAIVRGVIQIAHRLGLRTVAEGIEQRRQLETLLTDCP